MKPYTWKPEQTLEEVKNGAYWERNMLAICLANTQNFWRDTCLQLDPSIDIPLNGWYPHEGEGFDGWSRVVSLFGGHMTFHIPDDFDIGSLPQIQPNWDGHTTDQKWRRAMWMNGQEGGDPS